MKMVKNNLTEETYFSEENEWKYCGSSQLKTFHKCEAYAMAKLKGEWQEEKTTALLIGSYVDAYYEGTLDKFKEENMELICTQSSIKKFKEGKGELELKAEFKKADEIIARLEQDELFSKYMSGEKQVIFTGEIEGVPFKVKADSFHRDKAIADLKVIQSFEPIWNNELNIKQNFVEYWKYHWQGAIYQEIIRQNTGKKLPFFLCAATKEKQTNFNVLAIPDDVLEEQLNEIKMYLPRIKDLKEGKAEPIRCEKCEYCIATKKLIRILDYREI